MKQMIPLNLNNKINHTVRKALLFWSFLLLAGSTTACAAPVEVTIDTTDEGSRFFVDGEPFYVKGAGADRNLQALAEAGANTIRTWGTEGTEAVIDEAHKYGLKVIAGLWVEHERHGHDYDDPEFVKEEIRKHKEAIDRFKNHPALLMWFIGNELEHEYSNVKVWDVVESIASYAKEVDPFHPVGTVTTHPQRAVMQEILKRCPSLDVCGVNTYAGINAVPGDLKAAGWEKPYMITEWGPNGHWEVPSTDWGAPIEQTSGEKAKSYAKRYAFIESQPDCLGSFVFFWGQKQEVTSTWYGMFTKEGRHTAVMDRMIEAWDGTPLPYPSPIVSGIKIDGKTAHESIKLDGSELSFDVTFDLLEGNAEELEVKWILFRESTDRRSGGDREAEPEEIPIQIQEHSFSKATIPMPNDPGAYRLFLELRGPDKATATANCPFLVLE
jgi:hypothetical protein